MIVVRLIWLAVLTLALPMWVGHCFAAVDKSHKNAVFLWISGQMLLWAGFQVICVPVILLEGHFRHVMIGYSVYLLVLLVLATVFWFRNPRGLRPVRQEKTAKSEKTEVLLWVIFAVLLLIQLVLAVVMVYGDGDDAYYVAISTAAQESGKMYQKIPYTGMNTELDVRHGLAPFPIWIAWLAQMTGISTVVVAKTLLPVVLISMTYGVFYLLGSRILFSGQSVPLFLICTEVLVMFGDYSFYTVENFMIARSRQGKAALGSILIPMIFFLLLWLFRRLQEEKKITVGFWMLLGAVMISCCLASTMGALLACMLMGVAGICGAVCYKRFRLLLPLAACWHSLCDLCGNVSAAGIREDGNGSVEAVSGIYGNGTDHDLVPGEPVISVGDREEKIYPHPCLSMYRWYCCWSSSIRWLRRSYPDWRMEKFITGFCGFCR